MMNLLKITVALILSILSMPMYAAKPMDGKDIPDAAQQPWVLVETHVTTERSGGAIGSAFQEFSSRDRCEAAIKLMIDLANRRRGELGGSYKALPIAQCTPK